jgi:hypothetical protein
MSEPIFDQEMQRTHLAHLTDTKPDITREYTILDLLHKIDPAAEIDPVAEELVLDIADDFIDCIVTLSAESAKKGGRGTVHADDVGYVLQRKFGGLGLGGSATSRQPNFFAREAHLKKIKAIKEAQEAVSGRE